MSDAADRLAQAIRDLIREAVDAAPRLPAPQRPSAPSAPRQPHHYPEGERPGDPIDEELREGYGQRFGEPALKTWPLLGEGPRLIPVNEAKARLGISRSTFYKLAKDGDIRVVNRCDRTGDYTPFAGYA